ncbi:MAG: hypothetical protein ACOH2M_22390 [Cypionkella sp.]
MNRRWLAGVVIMIVVIGALLYFNQAPNAPDNAAANPALTGPSDPAPKP